MTDLTAGECIWYSYDKQVDILLFYVMLGFIGALFFLLFYLRSKRNKDVSAKSAVCDPALASVSSYMKDMYDNRVSFHLFGILQLILAFSYLRFYTFSYLYHEAPDDAGNVMQLFYSGRWKACCFLLCGIFALWVIYLYAIKREKGIYLPTLITLGATGAMRTPDGLLSVDFFHNGEISLPMQQLLSFGKMPYNGLDPIHGLCDYYFGLINHIFFDDTYFALSAAKVAGEMFIAMAFALAIGLLYKDEKYLEREKSLLLIYVFMPFIVERMGLRYVFFILGFIILSSRKIREDKYLYVFLYTLLCICAILWNVSLGAAFSIAFLPGALKRIWEIIPLLKDFGSWTKKERILRITGALIMLISVIAFLPAFIKIIGFLKENSAHTLEVNGNMMFGADFKFFATFGIFIPIMILFFEGLIYEKTERFISVLLSMLVLVNYACVRYDEGERLLVLAVFFIFFVFLTAEGIFSGSFMLIKNKEKEKKCAGFFVITGTFALLYLTSFSINYFPFIRYGMRRQEIPYEVVYELTGDSKERQDDPINGSGKEAGIMDRVVYVSGDSVGMPHLGTGFIRGTSLISLQNLQSVLLGESFINADGSLTNRATEGCVLDLTNKISHLVIFDLENITPYSSAYNMSTTDMQKRALKYIKEREPEMIIVSPYIRFDQAPLSLRSFYLYTKIMKMGYKPYMYGDVVYLLKGESHFENAQDGSRMFGLLMHKENLGYLPIKWERVYKNLSDEEKADFSDEVIEIDLSDKRITIGDDGRAVFTFKSDIDGEEHRFTFDIRDGQEKYLIPVGSSPFYTGTFF